MAENTAAVETEADFGDGSVGSVRRWKAEVGLYDREFKNWQKSARKVVDRYRDERDSVSEHERKFNILWSNTETLKPAVYSRRPKPEIVRRYLDKDPTGRLAARLLERTVSAAIDDDDFDLAIKEARDDYLLTARGQAWVSYEPTIEKRTVNGVETEVKTAETVVVDHVAWRLFGHTVAEKWSEVTAVWRKRFMTRDQLIDRFGSELGGKVPLNHKSKNVTDEVATEHGDVFQKALVIEVWDKVSRKVIWFSPDFEDKALEVRDDPLKLAKFFPCPRPLYGTITTDSLKPVPDYVQYQDQANELDELTERLSVLTEALRVAGVYDGSSEADFQKLLNGGTDNILIPVESWAAYAAKGGVPIIFLPIKEVAEVIVHLAEQRRQILRDLFEITGMADIIRGQSDPRETLGAQRIKGQFATLRLDDRQSEVQRFVRDIIAIVAEIVAEQFSDRTIALMSAAEQMLPSVPLPEGLSALDGASAFTARMQVVQKALALLRNDPVRTFRIDIETDSTIAIDQQGEEESRVKFLGAVAPFLQQSVAAAKELPEAGPLLMEMLLFGVRGFKAGRPLEAKFEEALTAIEAASKQPKQPERDPAEDAAQRRNDLDAANLKMDERRLNFDAQAKRAELENARELKRMELDSKEKIEGAKQFGEVAPSLVEAFQQFQGQNNAQTAAVTDALAGVAASLQQTMMLMAEAVQQMNAPKRIVRDPQGRPVGVEPVTSDLETVN